MTKDENDAKGARETIGARRKKPYVKPAFRADRVFETMALACGKVGPTQMQCRTVRKTS